MQSSALTEFTYFRGRVALYWILKALGIGHGDEVATQAFTCLAVPEAILACGAKPVFIDIEPNGYNLDPDDLRRKISSHTRAVVAQHTFGIPASMPRIMKVAAEAGIPVLEDCCHTYQSSINGKSVGSFGAASFYSFEWGKPIAIGIGGSAYVNDPTLKRRVGELYSELCAPGFVSQLKLLVQASLFQLLYRPRFYWLLRSAFHMFSKAGAGTGNYNPVRSMGDAAEDFQLSMVPSFRRRLADKLQHIEAHTKHSHWLVEHYHQIIDDSNAVHLQHSPDVKPVFSRYPLQVNDKERVLAQAREQRVEVADWYRTPVHPLTKEHAGAVHYDSDACPCAEERSREVISLPTHQRTGRGFVDQVEKLFSKAA